MADSNITKKALATALKELMTEMPLSKISVADISSKCYMNRKSFYYHFKDKYDLVNWIFDTEFPSIIHNTETEWDWDFLRDLVNFFYENRIFYRKALQITGQNSFTDHFREVLFGAFETQIRNLFPDDDTYTFQAKFFTDAIIIAIQNWLTEKDCMEPEEFIRQLSGCIHYIYIRYEDLSAKF